MDIATHFRQKFMQDDYDPQAALALKDFPEALRYFTRMMRVVDFVKAHDRLYDKYGKDLGTEVELYCTKALITTRQPCGRIFLADGYQKRMPPCS